MKVKCAVMTRLKAKVQVTALFKMKKWKNMGYFDGKISDRKTAIHVYGNNKGARKKLEFYKDSNS